jgi:hypothetical protein
MRGGALLLMVECVVVVRERGKEGWMCNGEALAVLESVLAMWWGRLCSRGCWAEEVQ